MICKSCLDDHGVNNSCCRRSRSIAIHAKIIVDRAYRQSYQIGRQAIAIVQFTGMAWLKAVILGRQPLYAVPAPSVARGGDIGITPVITVTENL